VSLDISAAFNCIEHNILLNRLHEDFGIGGAALAWIESFLTCRTQTVCVGGEIAGVTVCTCGVPQGSVLGPVLFTLYTSPLAGVVDRHGASHSTFVDDVNIYAAIDPTNVQACATTAAVDSVRDWYVRNGLLPHPSKSTAIIV